MQNMFEDKNLLIFGSHNVLRIQMTVNKKQKELLMFFVMNRTFFFNKLHMSIKFIFTYKERSIESSFTFSCSASFVLKSKLRRTFGFGGKTAKHPMLTETIIGSHNSKSTSESSAKFSRIVGQVLKYSRISLQRMTL